MGVACETRERVLSSDLRHGRECDQSAQRSAAKRYFIRDCPFEFEMAGQ